MIFSEGSCMSKKVRLKKNILILSAVMIFLSLSFQVHALSINFTDIGDTFVRQEAPTLNYGNIATVDVVNTSAQNQDRQTMIIFNNSCPSGYTIVGETLYLYLIANGLGSGQSISVDVHGIFNSYNCSGFWSETCPTWNLRPNSSQYNSSIMSSYNFTSASADGWYAWNVDNFPAVNTSFFLTSNLLNGTIVVGDRLRFVSKDDANNTALKPYLSAVCSDLVPPIWSLNSTNSTGVGNLPVLHSTYWSDNIGMSGFIFSTNASGSWVNDTALSFSNGWANVTKASPANGIVGWKVYANDTSNNWNSTSVFIYEVKTAKLTVDYPSDINASGVYSIVADYDVNSEEIYNATLTICYTFTTTMCDNMTEVDGDYVWNFSYAHDFGGIVQFNITACHPSYPDANVTFYITFFDAQVGVRFWEDLNMTQHYFNEFLWVYAKPHCDLYNQVAYLGLYDQCNGTAYHAKYAGGLANLSIWSPNVYDLYIVDGTVSWSCPTCEPSVVGFDHWNKFDTITISSSGSTVRDYFWNTTVEGQYPLFTNPDWNFWISIGGIVILIIGASLCAYFTDNAVATLFIIVLLYILLQLFHILGHIFWGIL
jgi:hypothetical protein